MDNLKAFARDVIRLSWEGCIDGADVQELAEKHKLIVNAPYDPAAHGDLSDIAEPGDIIYVFADLLK